MRQARYFYIFFLIIASSNCSFLFAQNNVDSINNEIDTVYSPTNFTTYQLKDRFSDPFSSLFSNNAYNINSSLIKLSSKYDTSGVFYLEEKIGSLNYRPSISIPFNSYDKFNTRKGTWTKPNTDTTGKYFVSKEGKPCFIYYDLDADGWRMATWAMTIKERT